MNLFSPQRLRGAGLCGILARQSGKDGAGDGIAEPDAAAIAAVPASAGRLAGAAPPSRRRRTIWERYVTPGFRVEAMSPTNVLVMVGEVVSVRVVRPVLIQVAQRTGVLCEIFAEGALACVVGKLIIRIHSLFSSMMGMVRVA